MQKSNINSNDTLMELRGINAYYFDRMVLNNINLKIKCGEVCAITGENGAGKTTLIRVIAGLGCKGEGEYFLSGKPVQMGDAKSAAEHGIWLIEQVPQIVENLSVEETIFLGHEETTKWFLFSIVRKSRHLEKIHQIQELMEWYVSPYLKMKDLSSFQQKMVLLLRAILFDAKLILLDDTMSGFSYTEKEKFFKVLRKINEMGVAIAFITLCIDDIVMFADHVVALKEGSIIRDEYLQGAIDIDRIISDISGNVIRNRYPRTRANIGASLMELHDVATQDDAVYDISMRFNEGEIVGLVVADDHARRSIVDVMIGQQNPKKGSVIWKGEARTFKSIDEAARAGISFLSDENINNVYQDKTVEFNVSLPNLDEIQKGLYLQPAAIRDFTLKYLKKIHQSQLQCGDSVDQYNYGTQRKVSFARVLCMNRVFHVLLEPTSGLDDASRLEIYNILNTLAHNGQGIALISMDVEEIVGMCDRIYAVANGSVVREFYHNGVSCAKVLSCVY